MIFLLHFFFTYNTPTFLIYLTNLKKSPKRTFNRIRTLNRKLRVWQIWRVGMEFNCSYLAKVWTLSSVCTFSNHPLLPLFFVGLPTCQEHINCQILDLIYNTALCKSSSPSSYLPNIPDNFSQLLRVFLQESVKSNFCTYKNFNKNILFQ